MTEGVNASSSPREHARALLASPFSRDVLVPFLAMRGALLLAGMAATAFFPARQGFHADAIGMVDALVRWDAVHYLNVAELGYGHGSDAFFPAYPTLTRLVGLVLPLAYAGVLVANVAQLVALGLLRRLVEADHGADVARRSVFMALIFPTSFFLSAAYAESTYLAFLLGAFVAFREQRLALASLAVWLACLARPQGFLCATLPFVFAWLAGPRTLRTFPWFTASSVLALVQLLLLHRTATGDPLGFLHAETVQSLRIFWGGSRPEPPPMMRVLLAEGFGPNLVRRIANAASLVLVATASIVEARRRRWDLASVGVLSVAMPLYFQHSLFDAASMGRYALLAFPIFALLGRIPETSFPRRLLDLAFPMLQLVFFLAFTSWMWAE